MKSNNSELSQTNFIYNSCHTSPQLVIISYALFYHCILSLPFIHKYVISVTVKYEKKWDIQRHITTMAEGDKIENQENTYKFLWVKQLNYLDAKHNEMTEENS